MRFIMALVALLGANLAQAARVYPPDDSLGKGDPPKVPQEFQGGTASLEDASAWVRALGQGSFANAAPPVGEVHSRERVYAAGELTELVFLALEPHATNAAKATFLRTPKGYRYFGLIAGSMLHWLSYPSAQRSYLLSNWHMSATQSGLSLQEVTTAGLKGVGVGRDIDTEKAPFDFDSALKQWRADEKALLKFFHAQATNAAPKPR